MEKAAELFERALEHYPDFDQARIGLARVLIGLGKPGLALPHLQKAVSLEPAERGGLLPARRSANGRLGNEAGQGKALAEFQRLQNAAQQGAGVTALAAARGDEAGAGRQAVAALRPQAATS